MHCAGEIVPQALCSRYGLQIGSYSAWFVRILIWCTWIIAYPISKILDAALGTEHGVSHIVPGSQALTAAETLTCTLPPLKSAPHASAASGHPDELTAYPDRDMVTSIIGDLHLLCEASQLH